MSIPSQKMAFDYLDGLKESGKFNMFECTPKIAKRFGIGQKLAKVILNNWMAQFGIVKC